MKRPIRYIWEHLPVTDGLADFLALGSRLPGEVRISSAKLNPYHLRPIKLVRVPIGDGPDFNVQVAKEGEETSVFATPMTPWLQHQKFPFHRVPSTVIEKKLNACAKENTSLYDSLKKRQLLHPLENYSRMVPVILESDIRSVSLRIVIDPH